MHKSNVLRLDNALPSLFDCIFLIVNDHPQIFKVTVTIFFFRVDQLFQPFKIALNTRHYIVIIDDFLSIFNAIFLLEICLCQIGCNKSKFSAKVSVFFISHLEKCNRLQWPYLKFNLKTSLLGHQLHVFSELL